MSTDTETQRFGDVRSIDWKTALGALIEFTGKLGIILSATVIYALFIVVVDEVVPLDEFGRAGIALIEFALMVPPATAAAAAVKRAANIIGDEDIPARSMVLLTVGVLLLIYSLWLNLIDLGVV